MPETTANYHHIPVRSAGLFVKGSFRTIGITKGIKAVIGKLKTKPTGSTLVQKYLLSTKQYTMAEAKAWVKAHRKDLKLDFTKKIEKKKSYEFRLPYRIEKTFNKENLPEEIPADVFSNFIGVFECTMSTSTEDWDKDIVVWSAIEKGARQLNERGIVLFNHKHNDFPIGRFLKAWGVKTPTSIQGIECGELHGYVGISKTADTIWTLIDEKVLKDMSVGGLLIDAESIYDEDDKFINRLIKDWDLFEGSVVNFGSNPDAQISTILGKMLKDRKGGVKVTKDETPEDPPEDPPEDDLPEEIDVWEIIQEKLDEKLESYKEEILEEVNPKIEETQTQAQQDLEELRTTTEESLEDLTETQESAASLLESLFGQQGYEVEEGESDPDTENDED